MFRRLSPRKAASSGAAFLFLLLGLGACAGIDRFGGSRAAVETWASARGFVPVAIPGSGFELFALVRGGAQDRATIYIEGDGAAWPTPYHPPADPTPDSPTALALAVADPAPLAIYLGRPCQYLTTDALSACHPRYWIFHRFAPEVLATYGRALEDLRQRFGVARFTLVGYSGGGVIAVLLANRRADVDRVITVAAPLSVADWVAGHGVSPLSGSLDPMADLKPRTYRQTHFVGERDKIVPPGVIAAYVAKHGGTIRRAQDFDHQCCWSRDWSRLLGELP
jgi:dienelactone hydrolase